MIIRQWDLTTQGEIGNTLKGHTHTISGVYYTSDKKYIISSSQDKTIRIWDSQIGSEQITKRIEHTDCIHTMYLSSNLNSIVFGDDQGQIIICSYNQHNQREKPLLGHTKPIRSLTYSLNDKYIASSSDDCSIRIWDPITRAQLGQIMIAQSCICSVNFSPNMKYLISGGSDKTVRIWNRETGQQIGDSLLHHKGQVLSTHFSIDGKYIISGGYEDKQIRVIMAPIN